EPGGVDQAHHVAGVRGLDRVAVPPEHRERVLGGERFARLRVRGDHAALELARDHAHERQPVPVRSVHAGLDLEHHRGERVGRLRGSPETVSQARGGGASCTRASRIWCTPKLSMAEAKITGLVSPARYSSWSWSWPIAARSSDSSTAVSHTSPSRSAAIAGS